MTIIEIAAYTALSLGGLAVLAGGAYVAWRVRARLLASSAAPVPARAQVIQLGAEPSVINSTDRPACRHRGAAASCR